MPPKESVPPGASAQNAPTTGRATEVEAPTLIDASLSEEPPRSFVHKLTEKFSPKKIIYGIDLGDSSVKVVKVRQVASGFQLADFWHQELPPAVCAKRDRRREYLIEYLRGLVVPEPGVVAHGMWLCSGDSVSISSVLVPKLSGKDLKGALIMEAKKQAAFSVDPNNFFYVAGTDSPEKGKLQVLTVASQRDHIDDAVAIMEEVGLHPAQINVLPFALENLVTQANLIREDEVVGVLDLGAKRSALSCFAHGRLQFFRELPMGGDQLTQSMMRTVTTASGKRDVSFEESEQVKKEVGIPGPDQHEAEFGGLTGWGIAGMVRPVLERLRTEIQRSLNYYKQTFKITKIDRLLICGGASRMKGFLEYLSKNLPEVQVSELNSLQLVGEWVDADNYDWKRLKAASPDLAVALGLVVRPKRQKFNLAPPELALKYRLASLKLGLKLLIPLFALAAGFMYLGVSAQVANYKRLITNAESGLEQMEVTVSQIQILDQKKANYEKRKGLLDKAVGRQPLWHGVLKELSHITSDNIVLKKIEVMEQEQPQQLLLQGLVAQTYTSLDVALSQYLIALDESPFFERVQLVSTDRDPYSPTPRAEFKVSCQLVY